MKIHWVCEKYSYLFCLNIGIKYHVIPHGAFFPSSSLVKDTKSELYIRRSILVIIRDNFYQFCIKRTLWPFIWIISMRGFRWGVTLWFQRGIRIIIPQLSSNTPLIQSSVSLLYPWPSAYLIYPKYSDTLNVRTPSFFLKRHLFYVSGHIPYRVFLLSVNVRTPKTCPLFHIKPLFFTTWIFCIFALFTCVSG